MAEIDTVVRDRLGLASLSLAGGVAVICCGSFTLYAYSLDLGPAVQGFVMIGGVVFGLLTALAAIVVGAVALMRRQHTGQGTTDHAQIGVAFGVVGLIVIGWFAVVAVSNTPLRNADGELIKSGYVFATEMHVGDCANPRNPDDLIFNTKLTAVPCHDPHSVKKFAVLSSLNPDWSPSQLPGKQRCLERMAAGASIVDLNHIIALEQAGAIHCFVLAR